METDLETDGGAVRLVDCMPLTNELRDIVRDVECLRGELALRMEFVIRFDYGHVLPWVRTVRRTNRRHRCWMRKPRCTRPNAPGPNGRRARATTGAGPTQ